LLPHPLRPGTLKTNPRPVISDQKAQWWPSVILLVSKALRRPPMPRIASRCCWSSSPPPKAATRVHRMQRGQLQAEHTSPRSHNGHRASERPPCCHKESAVVSRLAETRERELHIRFAADLSSTRSDQSGLQHLRIFSLTSVRMQRRQRCSDCRALLRHGQMLIERSFGRWASTLITGNPVSHTGASSIYSP
jgi:hypothetical protein